MGELNYLEEYHPDEWQCDHSVADGLEYLKCEMEIRGWHNKDLVGIIGTRGRVSEVINGRRELTLNMIRRLVSEKGLSANMLIKKSHSKEQSDADDR